MKGHYESRHFEQADELLKALAPISQLETETPSPVFIYRGHGDAAWDLIPSALRRGHSSRTKALDMMDTIGRFGDTEATQALAELSFLNLFIRACDRSALPLSGDGFQLRRQWFSRFEPGGRSPARAIPGDTWPPHDLLPIMAVAQHHGVPTRLLDWTRNPIIAAYFAASDALSNQKTGEQLAIWALNIEMIHQFPRIELVSMPGANSRRLGAQRGMFTLISSGTRHSVPVEPVALDQALTESKAPPDKPLPLWKLTLPKAEAVRLLFLCSINGVDAASVFPDLGGAARAACEEVAWRAADPKTGIPAHGIRDPSGGVKRVRSQRAKAG